MEIKCQATTYCKDGIGGKVSHILIHQRSWMISFLVVKEGRSGADWIVPLHLLESTSEKGIWLNCTIAQLHQFDHFTVLDHPSDRLYEKAGLISGPGTYAVLEASLRQPLEINLPSGYQTLYWGTQVKAADGQVGRIDAVRFEPRYQLLSALVIHQGTLWFKKEFAVPAHNIECIEPEMVLLNMDRCQIEALPAIPPHRS